MALTQSCKESRRGPEHTRTHVGQPSHHIREQARKTATTPPRHERLRRHHGRTQCPRGARVDGSRCSGRGSPLGPHGTRAWDRGLQFEPPWRGGGSQVGTAGWVPAPTSALWSVLCRHDVGAWPLRDPQSHPTCMHGFPFPPHRVTSQGQLAPLGGTGASRDGQGRPDPDFCENPTGRRPSLYIHCPHALQIPARAR